MTAGVRFGFTRWARLAAALVNTAPAPRHGDLLTAPEQLRDLLLAHDEPGTVRITPADLADARAGRTDLAAVFAATGDDARLAARLNDLLGRTARPRLVDHPGGVPLHLHVEAPDANWGGWLTASGAMGLALMIAEHGVEVIGVCAAADCPHGVLRVGPGPARRFCDAACANRTRVAAHRAARRAPGGAT
ncbi:CGNR zinc finger domain-containing protein [Plantactinospora siamensis]|uniref:CGNR zinc finger domain-containing protein n=1 Tax=Plantactinospora siamensis TaxID=555372 RepID=A0ABV6NV08_9ACTN